jgi:hypothetical protein
MQNKWETIFNYIKITGDDSDSYDKFNQAAFPFPEGSSGGDWKSYFTGTLEQIAC